MVLGREFDGHMVPIGRALCTQVDCHIEHTTLHHTNQLGLCIRWKLEVKTAHHTVTRTRLIVLHKFNISYLGEIATTVTLEEVASRVAKDPRLNYINTFYVSFN